MNAGRILREHRPLAVLLILSGLSLFSLVTGAESSVIHHTLARAVHVTSYPFLKLRYIAVAVPSRAYSFVSDYDAVFNENIALNREVVEAQKREATLHHVMAENKRLRALLGFVSEQPRLTLQPATVLESYRGMLRIDAGTRAGVKPAMGVIAREGVVGVVTEVADFTATVATLHHTDCRVGAMVLRNRLRAYDGVVHASGSDFSYLCAMEYIDMKDEVRVGDIVVTSPESQFPAGLSIGPITAVRGGEGLWKSAEIKPAVDPYRLDEVMVIMRAVDDAPYVAGPPAALERESAAYPAVETTHLQAPEMPDMRSLQERYAP